MARKVYTNETLDASTDLAFQIGRLLAVFGSWVADSGSNHAARMCFQTHFPQAVGEPAKNLLHLRKHFFTVMPGSLEATGLHIDRKIIACGGIPEGYQNEDFQSRVMNGYSLQRELLED
jgi:hypothetical protein